MEKAKALFHSMTIEELIFKYRAIGFNWQIRKGTVEERYERIQGKYEDSFQKQFKETYQEDIKDTDLVSYLDTLSLMKTLEENLKDLIGIDVFMEYLIPYAQKKRIDYLITFRNTVVILEFCYFDHKIASKKYMEIYHQKLLQVMQYEKLLQNMISTKIKTIPYVILYSPDIDEKRNSIANHNQEKMIELAELIKDLYFRDTTATEEIKSLSS